MSEIPTGSARGNEWLLVKGYAVNDRLRRDQLGELRQLVQVMGRTLQILRTLKSHQGEALDDGTNVGINVGEMSEVLGITSRQCERILASLKQKGLIARVGAAKGGHWKIRL